jgi:hypothetical protein
MVLDRTEGAGAPGNPVFLFGTDPAGIDEGGVHIKALFLQGQHTVAGIQAAGKGQHDGRTGSHGEIPCKSYH